MSNPNALFLLADHVKLSLLERQRAKTLNLDSDSQDGHISRSLDQFRDGLEALQKEQKRLEAAGEEDKAANIADSVPALQKQLDDLTSQFHGFSSPSSASTLTRANDPALAADFAHATTLPGTAQQRQPKTSLRAGAASASSAATAAQSPSASKSVRFSDNPAGAAASTPSPDLEAQQHRAGLFGTPYRDDPDAPAGYRDAAEAAGMSNTQIHAYHEQVLADQDAQLDELGASIGRQRELSMRIGDELDSHVALLDESDRAADRHQNRLDRAKRMLGRVAKGAGDNKQMTAIVILIIILVLLIIILK